MSYELKIERLFDAPPEVVFDTLVDPDAQEEVFNDQVEGWKLWEFEIDLRVGGTWTIVYGREDEQGEPDRITNVFTEILVSSALTKFMRCIAGLLSQLC